MNSGKLSPIVKIAAGACLVLAAWIVFDLSHWWATIQDYSFGYLAPIFSGYVIYDRWPRIAAFFGAKKPDGEKEGQSVAALWLGRVATVGLIWFSLCFAFGLVYRAFTGVSVPGSFIMTVSFAGIVLLSALAFSDRRADGSYFTALERWGFMCLFLFPALVWIISAPLMSIYEGMISEFLLDKVTAVVFTVFDSLGFVIERRGNVLVLPNGSVGVEEACSGIRSLTGCLFAGSFLAAVFLDRFWKKITMIAAALVLAFCTNIIRGMVLTGIAYEKGSAAIEGTVHDVTGYAVLGVTVVLLLCLIPVFNYKLPQLDEIKEDDSATSDDVGDETDGGAGNDGNAEDDKA